MKKIKWVSKNEFTSNMGYTVDPEDFNYYYNRNEGIIRSLRCYMKENNLENSFYLELLNSDIKENVEMLYIMLTNENTKVGI